MYLNSLTIEALQKSILKWPQDLAAVLCHFLIPLDQAGDSITQQGQVLSWVRSTQRSERLTCDIQTHLQLSLWLLNLLKVQGGIYRVCSF